MLPSLEMPLWLLPLAAYCSAIGLTCAVAPLAIRCLARHCREPKREIAPHIDRLRQHKRETPTMGGLFLVPVWCLVALYVIDIQPRVAILSLATLTSFAVLGGVDDTLKIRERRGGLTARTKFAVQLFLAAGIVYAAHRAGVLPMASAVGRGWLSVPAMLPTWLYGGLAVLTIVATSNAVNLTDGLDGLASTCLAGSFLAFAVLALSITLNDTGNPAYCTGILSAAAAGAFTAFLFFNRPPARIFMGDTGSLSFGALLGVVGLLLGQELLLIVIGGVYVAEAISVILQVASFRLRGRRIFRCAPLHHHFQLLGWSERQTVALFSLSSTALAMAGLAIFVALEAEPNTTPNLAKAQKPESDLSPPAVSRLASQMEAAGENLVVARRPLPTANRKPTESREPLAALRRLEP